MSFLSDLTDGIEVYFATKILALYPQSAAGLADYHRLIAEAVAEGVFDAYGTGGGGGGGGASLPIVLTTDVSGVLPVANGGTGSATAPAGGFAGLTALAAEAATRAADDVTLAASVTAEAATRAAAITSEAGTRASADTAEAASRVSGDAASVATASADATTKANAAQAAAIAASQPLDSDLTAIAGLATTSYGRGFLTRADAAAGRTYLALGSMATEDAADFDAAGDAAAAFAAAVSVAAADAYAKAAAAEKPSELSFLAGIFRTNMAGWDRCGGRKVDLSLFPSSANGLSRHVQFLCDVQKTSGATSVEVELYDVTHSVQVGLCDLTHSSDNALTEKSSGDLTVGASSGNLRSDVASVYQVHAKMNGGGGSDAVYVTNARLAIFYS